MNSMFYRYFEENVALYGQNMTTSIFSTEVALLWHIVYLLYDHSFILN